VTRPRLQSSAAPARVIFQPDFYGVGEAFFFQNTLEEDRPALSRPAARISRLARFEACRPFAAAGHRHIS
jgi:hypothetical protein